MNKELSPYITIIKEGGVVAFPTETVYGLGADARNPSAIKKVFDTKGRPSDNPLIVHVSSKEQVREFSAEISDTAQILMDHFWPGPLTLVLPKKQDVLDLITAGLDTVALRMPNHKLALALIDETGPLVAPSANTSGKPSPTKAIHVQGDFGKDFPVIDGGSTEIGLESTVLDLSTTTPAILRPGKIGSEELEAVLNIRVNAGTDQTIKEQTPKSPGQKYSHYKPKADVFYGNIESIQPKNLYLVQSKNWPQSANVVHYQGNLTELSRELYDRFRQADIEGYESVFIEQIEGYKSNAPSLYHALINRIQKATAK